MAEIVLEAEVEAKVEAEVEFTSREKLSQVLMKQFYNSTIQQFNNLAIKILIQ